MESSKASQESNMPTNYQDITRAPRAPSSHPEGCSAMCLRRCRIAAGDDAGGA
jgi:hypothetical protein